MEILVTEEAHPVLLDGLSEIGWHVDYQPDINLEEIATRISGCNGLIIKSKTKIDKKLLDQTDNLEFIGRIGSGLENIDLQCAAGRGIKVLNSPEGNRNAVAEHALGMLLCLANNINRADTEVRNSFWQREVNRGWELRGKTIGIIGFGNTGSQFARVMSGFEINILAYDKYLTNFARETPYVTECTLGELREASDIISLHIPLTPETFFLVDNAFIDQCTTGFILINTSRGKCVQTTDLVNGLKRGKVGGACLDVLENEDPDSYSEREKMLYGKLYEFNNTVLTPHIAGWTEESKYAMGKILLGKIKIWAVDNNRKQGL